MENLIALVNRLQRACTALGDHGEESALPTLWDALPSIAVVGGQVDHHFFLSLIFDSLYLLDLSILYIYIHIKHDVKPTYILLPLDQESNCT